MMHHTPRPSREPDDLARFRGGDDKEWQTVQNRRAARTVASHATDGSDCSALLAMLGLQPADGKPEQPPVPW